MFPADQKTIASISLFAFLAACGGSDSGSSSGTPQGGQAQTIIVTGASAPASPVPAAAAITPAGATPTTPAAPVFAFDTTARFNGPDSIAADATGNLFVLDTGNKAIRKIAVSGEVSTLASGLTSPSGLEIDGTGNLYTNDAGALRKIAPDGSSTLLASVPATASWMTIDPAGNLYLLDHDNAARTGAILKVDQAGAVTTLFTTATNPELNDQNRGIARDAIGNIYVGTNVATVLRFTQSGASAVFARGFNVIQEMAFDAAANLFVADFVMSSHIGSTPPGPLTTNVRKIAPDGTVATLLSSAPGASGLAFGADGNLYAPYSFDHTVQKITPAGSVTTIAGKAGEAGSSD